MPRLTFATQITIARIILVPVFAACAIAYGLQSNDPIVSEFWRYAALAVFITASASDALDGYLARHCNQGTKLGAWLDPIADKFLLLTALLVLSLVEWGPKWSIPVWLAVLVFGRDIMVLCGCYYLKRRNGKLKIDPTMSGKICTVLQMIAIGWVMLKAVPFPPAIPAAFAAVATVWSGIDYFKMGWRQL